jgi:Tol biopolymer transport system component
MTVAPVPGNPSSATGVHVVDVRDASTDTAGQTAAIVASSLLLLVLGAGGCGSAAKDAPPAHAPKREHPRSHGAGRSASSRAIALSSLHGRIAFSHGDDVWVANANGRGARRLTRRRGPEFDPSWSPDGRRIAYRDSRHGINRNDEIYVMNADGTHARNLTRSPYNEWSPSWSSDGELIAFYSGELFVMRPDGSRARPITRVEGEYPAWSPDGQQVAFMSAQPGARGGDPNYDVFVMNRDGSRLRQLTDWPGEDGWPAWSPDGRSIAFTTTHGPRADGRYLVYLMDADGSHKRLLTRRVSGGFPVWSPDGKAIMFSDDDDHLWVARPDGSGLRKLPIRGWLVDWRR